MIEYDEDDYLQLSGIQHFAFCRRQWALIHVEQQWRENILTTEGQIAHERVHDASYTDSRHGIVAIRGMQIKSASLGVSGTCDLVELIPDDEGIVLAGRDGKWRVRPVEYKHGKAKQNDCDRLQAVSQAMCLEEMLCCSVNEAVLFYCETKRRETITITNEMRMQVENMFNEMHDLMRRGYTPKVKTKANCKHCSLFDICMSQSSKQKSWESVQSYITNVTMRNS